MRPSLRWTLLGWYAAILVSVIGVLGSILYVRQRSAAFDRADAELKTHALAIAGSIEWDEHDGFEFELSDRYRAAFQPVGPNGPYYVIWDAGGRVLARSPGAPAAARPAPIGLRRLETGLEIGAEGSHDTRVLVGRGTVALEQDLRAFGWTVLLSCLAALSVALLGGFFLVRRVLAPIERISAAASRISVSNLSERIDVGRTESELGRLAGVLNEAFDRLQAAVERQARFTADASHELRTPLAVLRANAEWGLRAPRPVDEHVETLESMLGATKRMGALVERLLALARGDGDERAPASDPLDLAAIAADTAAFLQPLAQEHAVALRVVREPAPTTGDAARLLEAVAALVVNAIEHGGRIGSVTLTTGVEDGAAFVAVADEGVGIPEADLPRVFDRFYRVDASRSTNRGAGGSGLGLAIARQIVEADGGSIGVESAPEGGAVFTIRLPAADRG